MTASLRPVLALASREFRSAFVGPSGWIVLAIASAVACASFFGSTFAEGQPATLRMTLQALGWAILATAPALSMRSFSEEFRLKTWETLFASPLGTAGIVAGKALACAALVAATLVPAAALAIPLELHASPDYGELACGLLGLFLAGFAAASIGIAISTTTSSQAVAFLGAFFAWLGLVAGSRVLTGALPIEYAPIAAAIDPQRRLQGFSLGLFDSAGVAYFVAIAAVALVFAKVSLERIRDTTAPTPLRRIASRAEGVAFVVATLAAAAAAVALSSRAPLRVELDATKTRAYSLAPATQSLLASLEGPWRILLFVDGRAADPAVLRQVDEVLRRFEEAGPGIEARRIDPSDPGSSGAFEEALASLVALRAGDIARTQDAIERGVAAYDAFRNESTGQPAGLRAAAAQLPAESPVRRTVEQVAALFAQVATDGEQFRTRVVELSRTSAARPLPDLEGARSALAQGFRVWGDQLAGAATLFAEWRSDPALPQPVRNVLAGRIALYEGLAERMMVARQELEALPALELDTLNGELMKGEAAVVAGNGRLAVIPTWRIFPRSAAGSGTERISYSWSFRGEEVLSGAIRSIAGGTMPEVVFTHSERESILRARSDHNDLAAVADALRSAGFAVLEWVPARDERPKATPGRPQVFVIVPALRRGQLELGRDERALVEQASRLVGEGKPVLLTAGRSLLALLGQPDPWQKVLAPFGLEPDGTKVVLELVAKADGTPEAQPWQLVEQVEAGSPLAARLAGRPILFNQPVPLRIAEPLPEGVSARIAVSVPPGGERWLADDWKGDGDGVREVPATKRLQAPVPVVALAERRVSGVDQRVALVGSGGWMLTSVADLSDNLGGGRTALYNPGNRELVLASVAWLSGREDLLDAGLSGREVSRIAGLSEGARLAWLVGASIALIVGPIAVGGFVAIARRRRA